MSGQANVRRAASHWATVQWGYCPIGLLSCRVTVSRATTLEVTPSRAVVHWAMFGRLLSVGVVFSGRCLSS